MARKVYAFDDDVLSEAKKKWHGDNSMEVTDAVVAEHPDRYPGWSGMKSRGHEEFVKWGHALQQAAQPVSHPLYHGVGADVTSRFKVGDTHHIPVMATSRHRHVAEDFAEPGGDRQEHTIYEFAPGAHATEIHEGEHVVTGKYRVTYVEPGRIIRLEPHEDSRNNGKRVFELTVSEAQKDFETDRILIETS